MSFADNVISFNQQLEYAGDLPNGFRVINPYLDNSETMKVMQRFYKKYYDDSRRRKLILGINPGRHGAAVTGVPFTDTKRLDSVCGIKMQSVYSHEISSVFIYEMITAFGGAMEFYNNFYINSPFPLAIIKRSKDNKWVNANYYDDERLFKMLRSFMIATLKEHISMGIDTSYVTVLGVKNASYLRQLNKEEKLFGEINVLEHPRYIQQYKAKEKLFYIDKFINSLKQ